MRTALLIVPAAVLLALAVFACPANPGAGEGEKDGGTQIEDGGFTGEGEGEGAGGEGEGEGEGAPADAGFQGSEYTGAPEDGTKCGNDNPTTICAIGTDCCVSTDASFNIVAACGDPGQGCPQTTFGATVACDGKEDCASTEECCFDSGSLTTTCVAAGTCEAGGNGKSTVCVNTGDCVAGTEICCGAPGTGGGGAFSIPVDLGICQPANQNCSG